MIDTSDLVERLTHRLGVKTVTVGPGLYEDIRDAATTLTAKDKEIKELKSEIERNAALSTKIVSNAEKNASELASQNTNMRNDLVLIGMARDAAERERDAVVRDYQRVNGQLAETLRERDEARAALKRSAAALETSAARFNLMGGVGLVNGADPRVGYKEAMEEAAAARAVIKQGKDHD